ncbi:MAG: transaldolase [Candidatus Aquicultorales bacterium]
MRSRVFQLGEHGQSVWMDYLDRDLIEDGSLDRMMKEDGVSGVTSNPTIFKEALKKSARYDSPIRRLAGEGRSPGEMYDLLVREDVALAADILRPLYDRTGGEDGYVSLELVPSLAYDAKGSVKEAERLNASVARENVIFKVPGTEPGLDAVRSLTASGIKVNITLLFSPERYSRVAEAYLDGISGLLDRGGDARRVFSVASFFLSRIDTKVDRMIDRMMKEAPDKADVLYGMRGSAAIATAKTAYGRYQTVFSSGRFQKLRAWGARKQKVLWASMSAKDPEFSDVKYVAALIGPDTIATVPQTTLEAMRDHLMIEETLELGLDAAPSILERLASAGIDLPGVYEELEREGVAAFQDSYEEVIDILTRKSKESAA